MLRVLGPGEDEIQVHEFTLANGMQVGSHVFGVVIVVVDDDDEEEEEEEEEEGLGSGGSEKTWTGM